MYGGDMNADTRLSGPKQPPMGAMQGLERALERLGYLHAQLSSLSARMSPPRPEQPSEANVKPQISLVDMPNVMNAVIDRLEKLTAEIEQKLF